MCDCIKQTDEVLKEHNTKLSIPIRFTPDGLKVLSIVIATEKIDNKKRKGPVMVMASFCPFCGEEIKIEE